jgi:Leucine-rich repeat (LRR) protein
MCRLCTYEQTLTCVNLGSNKLSRIPPEFGLLSRLTDVDVRYGKLEILNILLNLSARSCAMTYIFLIFLEIIIFPHFPMNLNY